jgi:hypothetical protein
MKKNAIFMTMKAIVKKNILGMVFLFASVTSFPQCKILNRVSPDGSMQYYMEPVNLYWTKTKSLKGCIVTDKENYFLELYPVPFPEKPEGKKLKEDLALTLSDGTNYELKHYDTRYLENDTALEMLFLIEKKDIDKMMNFEINEAKIDMKGDEGIRTYVFKLQKLVLKDQLACFLNEEKKEKNKSK